MPKRIDDETRSIRHNLLMTPQFYEKIMTLAALTGEKSFNNYVTKILKKHVEQNAAVLSEYEQSRKAILQKYVDVV